MGQRQARAERDRLIATNEKLRQLLRKAQGSEAKSERLAKLHPDQLNLAPEDIEQTIAKAEAMEEEMQASAAARKRWINRGAVPAHLARIHETLAPADTNSGSCSRASAKARSRPSGACACTIRSQAGSFGRSVTIMRYWAGISEVSSPITCIGFFQHGHSGPRRTNSCRSTSSEKGRRLDGSDKRSHTLARAGEGLGAATETL